MNNRKEELLAQIRTAGVPNEEDRKELFKLLQSGTLQRMLFAILTGSDDAVIALTNADYTNEHGVKQAILLQARARCYSSVVEDLVEYGCTDPQPQPTENKETT